MTIYISLLIGLIGLLGYAFSSNAKAGLACLGAWVAGLTAFLITLAGHTLHLP